MHNIDKNYRNAKECNYLAVSNKNCMIQSGKSMMELNPKKGMHRTNALNKMHDA